MKTHHITDGTVRFEDATVLGCTNIQVSAKHPRGDGIAELSLSVQVSVTNCTTL